MLRSIIDLQAAINRNLEQHNDDPKPFIWTKPAYPILAKLDRLPVPLRGSLLTLRWREIVWTPSAGQGRLASDCHAGCRFVSGLFARPMTAGLDGLSASRGSHLDFALDAHSLAAGLPG